MNSSSIFSRRPFHRRRFGTCETFVIYIKRFLRETVLQGLPFAANERLTIWERLYFFACFWAVVIVAIVLSYQVYVRWDSTPILISMEAHLTDISTVPFPAVTVCNMNQISNHRISKYRNDSLEYAMAQKICFQDVNYESFTRRNPTAKADAFGDFIIKHGQPCDNMISYCKFGPYVEPCSSFFREVLLDEGICCSFNVLHPSFMYKGDYLFVRDFTTSSGRIPVDWSPETGYGNNLPRQYYPRAAEGAGVSMGFSIAFNTNISDYYCSSTHSAGIKVILHNPIDTPFVKETSMFIKPGHETQLRIKAVGSKAQPTIRGISVRGRQCVFNNEIELHYYKYYSRQNCEMECDSKYILRKCNCIPYYLPFIYANITVCHIKHFDCLVEADKEFNMRDHFECKQRCLPSCFDLSYYADMFFTPFAQGKHFRRKAHFLNYSEDYIHENLCLVHIYYTESFFRSTVKTPYTGFTEYLSLTGGIMSLMMGFSVISIVELVYFFILGPFFDFVLSRPLSRLLGPTVKPVSAAIKEQKDELQIFTIKENVMLDKYPARNFSQKLGQRPVRGVIGGPKSFNAQESVYKNVKPNLANSKFKGFYQHEE